MAKLLRGIACSIPVRSFTLLEDNHLKRSISSCVMVSPWAIPSSFRTAAAKLASEIDTISAGGSNSVILILKVLSVIFPCISMTLRLTKTLTIGSPKSMAPMLGDVFPPRPINSRAENSIVLSCPCNFWQLTNSSG